MARDGHVTEPAPVLTIWTIYFSPLDYPGLYVVRAFDIVQGSPEPIPRAHQDVAMLLEDAREFVPRGLIRIVRNPCDHESVVELWA